MSRLSKHLHFSYKDCHGGVHIHFRPLKNKVSVFHSIYEVFGFKSTRVINHCSYDTDLRVGGLEGHLTLLVVLRGLTSMFSYTFLNLFGRRIACTIAMTGILD